MSVSTKTDKETIKNNEKWAALIVVIWRLYRE